MIPATHKHHVLCRLQCEYVLFLFNKFYRLIGVSKIPNEHATLTCTENVLAVSWEFYRSDVTFVASESGQARQGCHVPKMQTLVTLVTGRDKQWIGGTIAIIAIWSDARSYALDGSLMCLDIRYLFHFIKVPYFEIFVRCREKQVLDRSYVINLMLMRILNISFNDPVSIAWQLWRHC